MLFRRKTLLLNIGIYCKKEGNQLAVKLYKWFTSLIEILVILLALALLAPRIFGVKCFAVTSASMAPAYPVGCIVYASPTDPEKIVPGDVISFNVGTVTATHRVISVDRIEHAFTTQGDANSAPDGSPVDYSRVIGKVVFSLPLLGYLVIWLTPKRLILVLIGVAVLMLLPIGPGRNSRKNSA